MNMRAPTPRTRRLLVTMSWLGWCIAVVATCTTVLLGLEVRDRLRVEAKLRSSTALLEVHRGVDVEAGRPLLLLTGDSRAAALGKEPLGRFTVENRGLAGQTSIELVARIGRDMAQLRPDRAVVIIGVNDLKAREAGDEEVRNAFASILEIAAIAEAMDIPLTICPVWPAASAPGMRGMMLPEDLPSIVTDLNERTRALADDYGTRFVEVGPLLNEEGTSVLPGLSKDALHLNSKGNEILRKSILDSIDAEVEDHD